MKVIPDKYGYANVNGIKMYHEIYGHGKPLVLIHGGGSTIQTSFSRIIPALAANRQVIAVELQAHGRSGDRDSWLTFAQDADDVAALLQHLGIPKADFLGFSNGGQTAIEIALRHPDSVRKLLLCSTFTKRSAAFLQFWEGFDGKVQFTDMPQPYHEAFLKVNNNPDALLNMFNKDVQRMSVFKDWADDTIRSIKASTLVVNGDADVGSCEHAVEMHRMIEGSNLAIFPGFHGGYLGEITTGMENSRLPELAAVVFEEFLDR